MKLIAWSFVSKEITLSKLNLLSFGYYEQAFPVLLLACSLRTTRQTRLRNGKILKVVLCTEFCPLCDKQVIASALGQLRINFTCIFKVFQIALVVSQLGQFCENYENTSEINPLLPSGPCDCIYKTHQLFAVYTSLEKFENSTITGHFPGDLVTSLRETGEKILLPYPIRQLTRSREFAFAVIARANVDAFPNFFVLSYTTIGTRNCAVTMRSVDLDSWEVSFTSMVNLFYTWMEAIWVLQSYNMQRRSYRIVSLKSLGVLL